MYLVDREKCEIELVWIYTHEEFPKRPSDKDLKQILDAIQQAREDEDGDRIESQDSEKEQE
ncbi:hypothetical protein [Spirulina sp. 06S082]|uniref:hypothetical protein n=1 Tax=Spirulina sp. 06S082 TaxID=3110248 RepID=UPI002B1FC37A|nr:hypothetical protein [Spirulina sp. 06S082]MEA5471498.1 hypothetical protein [Spirulina sp. 06S082]